MSEASDLTRALGGFWRMGRGLAHCPVPGHGRGRGDRHPSLSVSRGDRRPVVFHCHAGCSQADVIAALERHGLWPPSGDLAACAPASRGGPVKDSGCAQADLVARLWWQGEPLPGTPGDTYLRKRHVATASDAFRFLSAHRHGPSGQSLPTLLSVVRGADGRLQGVHRTYLTDAGQKAPVEPPRMMLGPLSGGSVQLAPAGAELGLAEGVETALSAIALFGLPVWAACGSRQVDVQLPRMVRRLVLFADHDAPGIEATETARARFEGLGMKVEISMPETPGDDWNDVLVRSHRERRI